jgi:hypothetical protein
MEGHETICLRYLLHTILWYPATPVGCLRLFAGKYTQIPYELKQ